MSSELDFLADNPVNPVRKRANSFLEQSSFENIDIADYEEVKQIVKETEEMKPENLDIPTWGEQNKPWFQVFLPDKTVENEADRYEIAHFLLSINAINFYFHGEEGKAEYGSFEGAEAMQARLKELNEKEGPLDGHFWKEKSEDEIEDMLDLNVGPEMKTERAELLKEVGKGLEKYDGSFLELLEDAEMTPYTPEGAGIADLTAEAMPEVFGSDPFDKRNQLNIGVIYGRAQDSEWFDLEQPDRLTVFADYMIPVKMNEMNLVEAPNHPGSVDRETEREYRNATIIQADRAAEALQELYQDDENYDDDFEPALPIRLDSFFWTKGRELHHDQESGYSAHRFKTTDY